MTRNLEVKASPTWLKRAIFTDKKQQENENARKMLFDRQKILYRSLGATKFTRELLIIKRVLPELLKNFSLSV